MQNPAKRNSWKIKQLRAGMVDARHGARMQERRE